MALTFIKAYDDALKGVTGHFGMKEGTMPSDAHLYEKYQGDEGWIEAARLAGEGKEGGYQTVHVDSSGQISPYGYKTSGQPVHVNSSGQIESYNPWAVNPEWSLLNPREGNLPPDRSAQLPADFVRDPNFPNQIPDNPYHVAKQKALREAREQGYSQEQFNERDKEQYPETLIYTEENPYIPLRHYPQPDPLPVQPAWDPDRYPTGWDRELHTATPPDPVPNYGWSNIDPRGHEGVNMIPSRPGPLDVEGRREYDRSTPTWPDPDLSPLDARRRKKQKRSRSLLTEEEEQALLGGGG